jgi:hypothetical protein
MDHKNVADRLANAIALSPLGVCRCRVGLSFSYLANDGFARRTP